jgi:hypothetical protein
VWREGNETWCYKQKPKMEEDRAHGEEGEIGKRWRLIR